LPRRARAAVLSAPGAVLGSFVAAETIAAEINGDHFNKGAVVGAGFGAFAHFRAARTVATQNLAQRREYYATAVLGAVIDVFQGLLAPSVAANVAAVIPAARRVFPTRVAHSVAAVGYLAVYGTVIIDHFNEIAHAVSALLQRW
jgi:hypothetical protein